MTAGTAVPGATRRSWLRRLDDVLFGPEMPARLLAVQTLFLCLLAFRAVTSPYPRLAGASPALFKAVPVISWLDAMPARPVIIAVQMLVVLALVAWFAVAQSSRWRAPVRRAAYIVAWLGFLFLAALRASRGKIFHIELVLVWASLPLAFGPMDARWSDRTPSRRYGWAVRTAIGAMATIYCFTGIWKLRASGLEWVFSDNMKWALAWGRVRGEPPPLQGVGVWLADHAPLPEIFAGFILVFEVTFPIVLLWKGIRPLYVAAAWMFHMGTVLLLGLDYTMWPATVTILLVDWPTLLDRRPLDASHRSGSQDLGRTSGVGDPSGARARVDTG